MGRLRFALLILIVASAYGALFFRLYGVQVDPHYVEKAKAQVLAQSSLETTRGIIYFTDKRGNVFAVATNKEFPYILAIPKDVEDPAQAAQAVAPILGVSPSILEKKLSRANDLHEVLATKVQPSIAREIDALNIKGIFADSQPERFYPFTSLASHVLGYVGPNSDDLGTSGHYGIEELYNNTLVGVAGKFENNKLTQPKPGNDVSLTIDLNVQREAERILSELVEKYHATGGGAVVAEPTTGKILAMAAMPNFDPNDYSKTNIKTFLNPLVQEVYEPGSIFKVITMAAGIDAGKITPDTTYVDAGKIIVSGRVIKNYDFETHGAYGKVTMTNVIEHSINTGAVFAGRQTGRNIFTEYVKNFGFGEKTAITLPGELKGDMRRLNPKEREVAFATASYGYGVSVTAIELVQAIGAIANGGVLMRPYLDVKLEPSVVRRVISEDTAKKVTAMMVSAVDTAGVAKINGYTLAGKTGTAYVTDFTNGGYTDKVINTYVGFAPTNSPKFLVLIKLDKPEGAPVAALTVVPAFRELAEFVLNYYTIPPDRIEQDPKP